MRKILAIAVAVCALGVAGVEAAVKKAPATQEPDPLHPCTENCSTREGGYDWAEHYAIANAADCKGKSVAFVDGCKDYVTDIARPRDERDERDQRYHAERDQQYRQYGRDERDQRDEYQDDDSYEDDNDYDDNDNDNYDDGDDDDDDDGAPGTYQA